MKQNFQGIRGRCKWYCTKADFVGEKFGSLLGFGMNQIIIHIEREKWKRNLVDFVNEGRDVSAEKSSYRICSTFASKVPSQDITNQFNL